MSARAARHVLPALLLTAALGVGCGGGDRTPAPPGAAGKGPAPSSTDDGAPPVVAVEIEEAPPALPDREEARRREAEWRANMDSYGRGLVTSFDSRVYRPARDAHLRFAEAEARVRIDDVEGSFRLTFDATRSDGERVLVAPGKGADRLPDGSEKQIRKFADLAFEGPYRTVVHYLPPIELLLTRSRDGANRVVTAPPHKADVQVSYSFDDRDLVAIRGTSVRPQAEIVHYEWSLWRGRYLLERFWTYGTDASTDFEYDDAGGGAVLPKRALLRKGEHVFDVAFRYERVETGEPQGVDPPDDGVETPR